MINKAKITNNKPGASLTRKYPSSTTHATSNTQCQKCLEFGHWTYECKNSRVYKARPTRTQQLSKPLKPIAVELPEEFKSKKDRKDDNVVVILEKPAATKELKRKRKQKKEIDTESISSSSTSSSSSSRGASYSSTGSSSSSKSYDSDNSVDKRMKEDKGVDDIRIGGGDVRTRDDKKIPAAAAVDRRKYFDDIDKRFDGRGSGYDRKYDGGRRIGDKTYDDKSHHDDRSDEYDRRYDGDRRMGGKTYDDKSRDDRSGRRYDGDRRTGDKTYDDKSRDDKDGKRYDDDGRISDKTYNDRSRNDRGGGYDRRYDGDRRIGDRKYDDRSHRDDRRHYNLTKNY
ncbi:609_t:CDS:2 [Entrophospora sp. SA101]|nr:609_t:CDS:2 [Entrophospora sp. SA101]CAJ0920619.1 7635_t:CDS:2 [Entrophospora sp. SA101]